jgi:Bax protein
MSVGIGFMKGFFMLATKSRYLTLAFVALLAAHTVTPVYAQSAVVFGTLDQAISWLESEDWWGEDKRGNQLEVPHAMLTGIPTRWQQTAKNLPVAQKKEIFYRFMLPLVMHANSMVLDRRSRLESMRKKATRSGEQSADDLAWLHEAAVLLRIIKKDSGDFGETESPELLRIIDEALYKLDIVPAGLALGQAAYESGYGTSRFAVTGNALFGQWTFGGEGLIPEQQRSDLGDHRIAAFDWPFDSVRGYFINLCSHPAYEDFRRLRAELRAAGKPLSSMVMADGLIRYSERGQEYVDTLKGIMRVNKLELADDAVFRDEPIRFIVPANSGADAAAIEERIAAARESGEIEKIVARMRLE